MPIGKIKKPVHWSQRTDVPGEDEDGREVHFSHEMVAGPHGFDDMRRGQQLECALEDAPYVPAATVKTATAVPAGVLRPTA
jgi:hypothetical protein